MANEVTGVSANPLLTTVVTERPGESIREALALLMVETVGVGGLEESLR